MIEITYLTIAHLQEPNPIQRYKCPNVDFIVLVFNLIFEGLYLFKDTVGETCVELRER